MPLASRNSASSADRGSRPSGFDASSLDLSGAEAQEWLLSRLRHHNIALETLRLALDADDDQAVVLSSIDLRQTA